jgi:hypothetical protein
MKVGRILSLKKRIQKDDYRLHDTVKEMVNEWSQMPQTLIETLIERLESEERKTSPIHWVMADLLIVSRDPRIFRIYVKKRWLPGSPDFYLKVLKSGLNAEQIEGRLCEFLEREFNSEDGIYVREILDALRDYGSTDCLDVLQRLEYDLEKRFSDARKKVALPPSYAGKSHHEINMDDVFEYKQAELDVLRDIALSVAIESISRRDSSRDEDWLIDFQDFKEQLTGSVEESESSISKISTDLVIDFLRKNESKTLEFKESLRGGGIGEPKYPEWRVSRAIAAFANTEGGTLLIGVHDDGSAVGIDTDFASVNGGQDEYQLRLNQVIDTAFGKGFTPTHIDITFHEVESLSVCRVDVKRSKDPIFLGSVKKKGNQFWVRNSGQTNELEDSDLALYVKDHFCSPSKEL